MMAGMALTVVGVALVVAAPTSTKLKERPT